MEKEQEVNARETKEYDFDLPVDESASKPTAPRVHIGGSTCESCEG